MSDEKVEITESELQDLGELLTSYKDAIVNHEQRIAALETAVAFVLASPNGKARDFSEAGLPAGLDEAERPLRESGTDPVEDTSPAVTLSLVEPFPDSEIEPEESDPHGPNHQ